MSEIRSARPPADFTEVRHWILDSVDGLAKLRGSLFRELTGTPYLGSSSLDEIPEKMVLVTSELATNALRHGKPPTIVTLMVNGDEHLLDVADHDTSSIPALAEEREPGEGGFGLMLAQQLALDVGWYVSETTKHIWARFSPAHATPEGRPGASAELPQT